MTQTTHRTIGRWSFLILFPLGCMGCAFFHRQPPPPTRLYATIDPRTIARFYPVSRSGLLKPAISQPSPEPVPLLPLPPEPRYRTLQEAVHQMLRLQQQYSTLKEQNATEAQLNDLRAAIQEIEHLYETVFADTIQAQRRTSKQAKPLYLRGSRSRPSSSPLPPSQGFSCTPKKTCEEMRSCEEASYHFETCGNNALDGDNDGIPCDRLCAP